MNAYDRALGYLSRREHTVKELVTKLTGKGHSMAEIEDAILRLQQQGFQSDRRFAESYIRSRLGRTPEGKQVLMMRLSEKGVSRSLAKEVLDTYFEEHDEEIEKIFSEYEKDLEAKKGAEKARSTLIRKGIRRASFD